MNSNKINENNNKIVFDEAETEEYQFRYNFITKPWYDRTTKNKIGIVTLLVSMFLTTLASVAYNLYIHYNSYEANSTDYSPQCHFVKMEDYKFVAGVYTLSSKELLCLGAVIGENTVLSSGICIKSGPTRIVFGSKTSSSCKKGFPVDVIEPIFHQGLLSEKIVLLSSYDGMRNCGHVIKLGKNIDLKAKAYIFGRPLHGNKMYSRQVATVVGKGNCTFPTKLKDKLKKDSTICVTGQVRCPVRAGDLLIQGNKLYGIASTTIYKKDQNNMGFFADLSKIYDELQEIDPDMVASDVNLLS